LLEEDCFLEDLSAQAAIPGMALHGREEKKRGMVAQREVRLRKTD